jgi:hypothetical protein
VTTLMASPIFERLVGSPPAPDESGRENPQDSLPSVPVSVL